MNAKLIERMERIAEDTKKAFSYNNHTGFWSWSDRDGEELQHGGFCTRAEALADAVEPYMTEDEE